MWILGGRLWTLIFQVFSVDSLVFSLLWSLPRRIGEMTFRVPWSLSTHLVEQVHKVPSTWGSPKCHLEPPLLGAGGTTVKEVCLVMPGESEDSGYGLLKSEG